MPFYSPIAPIALWNLIWSDWWWSPKPPCKIQYLNFCDWATSYSDTLTIDLWHTDLNKWVSCCLFQTLNEKFRVINNNDERNNREPPLELNYILTALVAYLSVSCSLCACCLWYSLFSIFKPTKFLISFMLPCLSVEICMNLSHLLGLTGLWENGSTHFGLYLDPSMDPGTFSLSNVCRGFVARVDKQHRHCRCQSSKCELI